VHRTNKHIYAQIIDDTKSLTLAAASTAETAVKSNVKNGGNVAAAELVGKTIAEKATKLGIKEVVFDRSGDL
jgi:large subunit ribosomal protein L18